MLVVDPQARATLEQVKVRIIKTKYKKKKIKIQKYKNTKILKGR